MKNFTSEKISGTITEKKEGEISMYCNNCGKEVQPDWKMCPYCGSKNEKLFTPATQEPTPNPTPAPQPAYNQPAPQVPYNQPVPQKPYGQPAYQPSYNQQGYSQPVDFNKDFINPAQPKAKKKSKLPIIITAVVLVVAIVLGVIFIPGLLKGKDKDEEMLVDGNNTVTVWLISSVTNKAGKKTTYKYSDDYKTVTYEWSDGSRTGIDYFDESGKLIKTDNKSYQSGRVHYNTIYSYYYDNEGRLIKRESQELIYNDDVKITEYTYNDNGDRLNYWYVDSDSGDYIVFDSEGYIEEKAFMSGGERVGSKYDNSYVYVRDGNGKITFITEYESAYVYDTYELEYTSIEVSPEEAQFFKAQQKNLIEFNIIL